MHNLLLLLFTVGVLAGVKVVTSSCLKTGVIIVELLQQLHILWYRPHPLQQLIIL